MTQCAGLSYELHTGRELEFMLIGVKFLAVFYDAYPEEPCEEIIQKNAFKPYVNAGIFEKREFVELLDQPPPITHSHLKGHRYVIYSTLKENWRIDAYIEMKAQSRVLGWSEELERREGFLFGYEDWQTNAWIAHLRCPPLAKKLPWLQQLAPTLHEFD
jgi:hypothetical protein